MRSSILCVEDDLVVQTLIAQGLKEYNIIAVSNLKEAAIEISKNIFDMILLDIELPDGDGLKFYAELVHDSNFINVPTLFLTGHGDISNKLLAFSIGADDFITKPFDIRELNARVSSKLKKRSQESEDKKSRRVGDLEIDFDRQKVFQMVNGKEVDLNLTSIEIKILILLSKRIEQVFSRDQILNSVWGNIFITDRTVDSHIAHLRAKIASSSLKVDTVKNFGYRVIIKK